MTRATYENRQHIMLFVDYIWEKLPSDLRDGKILEAEKQSHCKDNLLAR